MLCSGCVGEEISRQFDAKKVAADLERYRRHGPDRTTQLLISGIRKALSQTSVRDGILLDGGAGVGVIHHEMLEQDVRDAIHVELAPAQLAVARQEVERRGRRTASLTGNCLSPLIRLRNDSPSTRA